MHYRVYLQYTSYILHFHSVLPYNIDNIINKWKVEEAKPPLYVVSYFYIKRRLV